MTTPSSTRLLPTRRANGNVRNTQISKLHRWLGQTPDGTDYFPCYRAGIGYRLHEDVTTDWDVFTSLLHPGPAGATTEALEAALALVRGRPLEGTPARRYGWADTLVQDITRSITEASYELARRRASEGPWLDAEQSALTGLTAEPGTEPLWRLRLLSLQARGQTAQLHRALVQLRATAQAWGGDLEPETTALLAQIIAQSDRSPERFLAGVAP